MRYCFALVLLALMGVARADDYIDAWALALKNDRPLIVYVAPSFVDLVPTPDGCYSCRVDEFPKAEVWEQVVLIPYAGMMWRIYECDPAKAVEVQKSWRKPDPFEL